VGEIEILVERYDHSLTDDPTASEWS